MNLLSPTMSGVMTGLLLIMFVGIWLWSWSSKRKPDFDRMANLPLQDDLPLPDAKEEKMDTENKQEAL